jgi:carbon monoxide dehydrogenase subunit G
MKVSGTASLAADRATVWRALNDPAVLVRTIPGCQRLEAEGEDAYSMRVAAGVGSIKGVYDGQVRLTDQQEPGSFRMHAEGAGAAGTIRADVEVSLQSAEDGTTLLSYEADATVGGMIGGVGQRMLAGVSKRTAAEFFRNVDAALQAESGAARPEGGAPEPSGASRLPPGPSTVAPPPGRSAPAPAPGTVFTAPAERPGDASGSAFARGVAVGAGAALVGALVGAWISRRALGRG